MTRTRLAAGTVPLERYRRKTPKAITALRGIIEAQKVPARRYEPKGFFER